ncbi:hypothetical protein L7F22_005789 [Adiantum nelumboides]|nr:hypothetical protein [Adiantum nelumboides]
MGCLPLHLLRKACITAPSTIKVMTVEGRFLRLDAPIIVKEVLMEYPGHALFLSDSVRSLGDRARPLPSTVSLQPGSVYFLVPQPTLASSRPKSAASMESSTRLAPSEPTLRTARPRKVSFATSADSPHCPMFGDRRVESAGSMASAAGNSYGSLKKSSVELLPSPSDGVLRLKMVVSKRQLASVLKEGGDCVSMVENLLAPLLQEAEKAGSPNISCNLSWRPSLQSIPESTWYVYFSYISKACIVVLKMVVVLINILLCMADAPPQLDST